MKRNPGRKYLFCIVAALFLCGCTKESGGDKVPAPSSSPERVETGFILTDSMSYDSADTAVLVEKNTKDKTLTFLNLNVGRRYTLSYDGTTRFMDKYGESLSVDQMNKGDIADLTFLKATKHLTTLALSGDTWRLERVTYYEMDWTRGEATIGQETKKYRLTENTQIYSRGKEISSVELNPVDILTFQGIDSQILTITVEQGHGYLRLQGEDKFIGGWLEIGQSQIHRITEDMVIPVAEGSYRILVSKGGDCGEKTAVIQRNEECIVDIGDIEVTQTQRGSVLFSVNPSSAVIYVDGEKIDSRLPVSLLYGLHQITIKADGYQSITQYLKVGQTSATVEITLDPVVLESEESREKDSYQVTVEAPQGVEVYLDGKYIGVAPCKFPKVAGKHIVTLRKAGYTSREYTIELDSEKKDNTYSFPELETGNVTGNQQDSFSSIVSDVLDGLIN